MDTLYRHAWVFGVLGLLCLVAFLSSWFVQQQLGGPFTTGFGVAAGLLFVLYGILDREALEAGASSRSVRFGGVAVMSVLLGVGVVGFGYVLADRHDHRFDWTADERFTLSERTRATARGLDRDVEVYAFFREGSGERARFERLIEGYTEVTDRLTVRWVDPLLHPRLAERFAVTDERGTVILVAGDDRQRLESDFDEENLTHALVRLLSGEDHRICWAMGHGEIDPDDDQSAVGLGAAVLKLEDQNYTVTKSNTLTQGIDPACEALVIARPTRDWMPVERERLAVYLAQGGRAFVLLEPETVPELAADLERYGVQVGRDIVFDTDPSHQVADIADPAVIALFDRDMALHPITRSIDAVVVFWVARSVGAEPRPGLAAHVLLQGSADSWGETTLDVPPEEIEDRPEAVTPTEGEDRIGDVPLMVAIDIQEPENLQVGEPLPAGDGSELGQGVDVVPDDFAPVPGGRIVVAGDADFASNRLISVGANQDLFFNSLAWLVEEEEQLAAGPDREGDDLTMSVLEGMLLWLIHVFLLPGAAVAAAVTVLLRRRFL